MESGQKFADIGGKKSKRDERDSNARRSFLLSSLFRENTTRFYIFHKGKGKRYGKNTNLSDERPDDGRAGGHDYPRVRHRTAPVVQHPDTSGGGISADRTGSADAQYPDRRQARHHLRHKRESSGNQRGCFFGLCGAGHDRRRRGTQKCDRNAGQDAGRGRSAGC